MEKIGEVGILLDIFSRLPVKCLLCCKSVNKQWRSLISDPEFAKLHLRRRKDESPTSSSLRLLWLNNTIRSVDCETWTASNQGAAVRVVDHPSVIPAKNSFIEILGSCDGLVCLLIDSKSFVLWNPTTAACNELPGPRFNISSPDVFYGFGYDFSTDDYKLVRGSATYDGFQSNGAISEIFSCRTKSWRRTAIFLTGPVSSRGLFLNGSLHWLESSASPSTINSFDLADEKFNVVEAPAPPVNRCVLSEGLMAAQDCLFTYRIMYSVNSITLEGWILREYEVESCWTKFCCFSDISPVHLWNPVWFREDSKVLVHSGHGELTIFDRDEGMTDCLKTGDYSLSFDYETYVESLISPFL